MKSRSAFLALFLIAVAVLGFLLMGWIERLLLAPAAELWFALLLFYRSIDEFTLWMLLISGLGMLAIWSLGQRPRKPVIRNPVHDRSTVGPVEDLAAWLADASRGAYFQWVIANRLARLAQQILNEETTPSQAGISSRLAKADSQVPQEMLDYLEAGLKRAPAPTGRKLFDRGSIQQPFKQDPETVISFLESLMEKRRGR